MSRKSSVHFQPVSDIRFAVSHSERTDISEPAYLLPKEHKLDNIIISGSMSENELSKLYIQQKIAMSGQAKARRSSPFWEGVLVLPDTNSKTQTENLKAWKKAYEKSTGHQVLHMSIHRDEGYVDTDGQPHYNPHAHVIVSRMDSKNRVIKLERKDLAAVQDLTALTLKMQRGSTLSDRAGRRGRKHVDHREYRARAENVRLDLEIEKLNEIEVARKTIEMEAKISTQADEISQHIAQYELATVKMKTREHAELLLYQKLKDAHEHEVGNLEKQLTNLQAEFDIVKRKAIEVVKPMFERLTQQNESLIGDNRKLAAAYNAIKSVKGDAVLHVPDHDFSERLRIAALPDLEKIAEAAMTLHKVATEALDRADGKAENVDWQIVEEVTAREALDSGHQSERAVFDALVKYSPAQVDPVNRDRLKIFIDAVVEENRAALVEKHPSYPGDNQSV